ncbi:MAG TPA: hypothetical protein VK993_12340, partial [Chthoniobacterales bacterium]|nr:hypothetical protein [Chthoniobacterales bacterium]
MKRLLCLLIIAFSCLPAAAITLEERNNCCAPYLCGPSRDFARIIIKVRGENMTPNATIYVFHPIQNGYGGVPATVGPDGNLDWVIYDNVAWANGLHGYVYDFYVQKIDTGEVIPTITATNVVGELYDGCANRPPNKDLGTFTAEAWLTPPPSTGPTPTPAANVAQSDKKEGGDQCANNVGMARYAVHSKEVSLNVQDTPVSYSPPRGPAIDFTVTYNQRENQQPASLAYSNFGPKWTFNWLSYVTDDPLTQLAQTGVYLPGGGAEVYTYNSTSQTFSVNPQSQARLVKTGAASYERRFPDGSKQIYALSDGAAVYPRRIFMTQWIDRSGNAATIGYDSSFRVTTITDALNQVTNVWYELPDDPLKITKVTDPFNRFATFEYASGKLTKIIDPVGIQSQFGYAPETDTINSLTTPYGTTTFASGSTGTNRWINITDPLGGQERIEYRDDAPGIGTTDPAGAPAGFLDGQLQAYNTFYWSKKALSTHPPVNGVYDYTKAKITHWLLNPNGTASGIPASEKMPLENRLWYSYAGQPDPRGAGTTDRPAQIARRLEDGTTERSQFEYNALGHVTMATDAVGRVTSSVYATNNVDLVAVFQRNPQGASTDPSGAPADKIASYTYNARHLPLTATDAAGQTTTFTYNAYGQLETMTNAKNELTTYAYGGTVPEGYLRSITSPPLDGTSAVTSFSYDSARRVRTFTDAENYTLTFDYDNLDRQTKITFPDATFQEFKYTDNITGQMELDLTGSRDRRGRWTYRNYNENRQMISITDPLNQTTLFGWCTCGSLESITDAKNQTTTFYRDIQGRVHQKVFADNTTINYLYAGQSAANTAGATSRLKASTDAKSQQTNYLYFKDGALKQISYTNSAGQALYPPTPTVAFTYDINHPRKTTMVDGTGTTTYGYHPIANPPALGAGRQASVDGPLANDTIALAYDELGRDLSTSVTGVAASQSYDALGRIATVTNPLGVFSNTYVGVSPRLQSIGYPNGQSTVFTHFPISGDRRLQTIQNFGPGAVNLSKFQYAYDEEGQINHSTRQFGSGFPVAWSNGANSMTDMADQLKTVSEQLADDLYAMYSYDYDAAGNRTSHNGLSYTHNNVNQLTTSGYAYDLNGNLTADVGRTFEWDAANRLIAINYTGLGTRTEFAYDGLNRRVRILEKNPGTSFVVQAPNTQY